MEARGGAGAGRVSNFRSGALRQMGLFFFGSIFVLLLKSHSKIVFGSDLGRQMGDGR